MGRIRTRLGADRRRHALGLLVLSLVLGTVLAGGFTVGPARSARGRSVRLAPAKPLVFGIYPGGAAGTVGPSGATVADNLSAQLTALSSLRVSGRPFVLHLYASYTGPGSLSAEAQAGSLIAAYTAAGFQTELVLAYRPGDGNPSVDVPGFVSFVRDAVASFGSNPDFLDVQVTNEPNISNAPNAADGYYPGVMNALVRGVVAAKAAARTSGFRQLTVGFNWAYSAGPSQQHFWKRLARSGRAFRRDLDWVGLDLYPDTWGPRVSAPDLALATKRTTLAALSTLRASLRRARIPRSTAIHIAENGYPTGSGRTPQMQRTVMRAAIDAISAHRAAYRITDYRWFDLRDANSASTSFQAHYGLMSDTYAPKPAFALYRSLVAKLGR